MVTERQVETAWAVFRADQRGGKAAMWAALEAVERVEESGEDDLPLRDSAVRREEFAAAGHDMTPIFTDQQEKQMREYRRMFAEAIWRMR